MKANKRTLPFTLFLTLLTSIFIFQSCQTPEERKNDLLPNALGGINDIQVVVDSVRFRGFLGDALRGALAKPIKGITNLENDFDLLKVEPSAFGTIFKKQHSIILVVLDKEIEKARINTAENVYAKGQTIMKIEAPNSMAAIREIEAKKESIRKVFNDKRAKKFEQMLFESRNNKHMEQLKKDHNLSVLIPQGYSLAKSDDNFAYFSRQSTKMCDHGNNTNCYYQNGIMIYYYPYTSDKTFTKEFQVNMMDSIAEKYTEGPDSEKGKTYIKTDTIVKPFARNSELNGKFCYQINGWWNMVNYTMGGPFVSISTVDEENNRVVTVEGFSFAPNFDKRAFVYELEAIARSIRFH